MSSPRIGSSVVSHQTVRLSRGSHRGPGDVVCVMELASMLAGEDFSDRPRSACPVIAAFLRTYNDLIDDDRRQDLYRYASEVVGTRRGRRVTRARGRLCRQFPARLGERGASRLLPLARSGRASASRAAKAAVRRSGGPAHELALAFVDELIAVGGRDADMLSAAPPRGETRSVEAGQRARE